MDVRGSDAGGPGGRVAPPAGRTGQSHAATGKPPPFRIRIFAMGTANGVRGTLVAELTDAANVGASEFYNSRGEFYFTLPATHPQAAVIEPYQTHYALRTAHRTGLAWQGVRAHHRLRRHRRRGRLLREDYLGLLSRAGWRSGSIRPMPNCRPTRVGPSTSRRPITFIIERPVDKEQDQAPTARSASSPVDRHRRRWPRQVTIYASFKQRLPFIAGLIDSSRAGTGRARPGWSAERDRDGTFKWRLLYDPGLVRDNLRVGVRRAGAGLPDRARSANWGTAVDADWSHCAGHQGLLRHGRRLPASARRSTGTGRRTTIVSGHR